MNDNEKFLLNALKAIMKLIDDGDLVRDISHDEDFGYFLRQSIRIQNALYIAKESIKQIKHETN